MHEFWIEMCVGGRHQSLSERMAVSFFSLVIHRTLPPPTPRTPAPAISICVSLFLCHIQRNKEHTADSYCCLGLKTSTNVLQMRPPGGKLGPQLSSSWERQGKSATDSPTCSGIQLIGTKLLPECEPVRPRDTEMSGK